MWGPGKSFRESMKHPDIACKNVKLDLQASMYVSDYTGLQLSKN